MASDWLFCLIIPVFFFIILFYFQFQLLLFFLLLFHVQLFCSNAILSNKFHSTVVFVYVFFFHALTLSIDLIVELKGSLFILNHCINLVISLRTSRFIEILFATYDWNFIWHQQIIWKTLACKVECCHVFSKMLFYPRHVNWYLVKSNTLCLIPVDSYMFQFFFSFCYFSFYNKI